MDSVTRWITCLNNLNEKENEIHKLQSKVVLKIQDLTRFAPYLIESDYPQYGCQFCYQDIQLSADIVYSPSLHGTSLDKKDTSVYPLHKCLIYLNNYPSLP